MVGDGVLDLGGDLDGARMGGWSPNGLFIGSPGDAIHTRQRRATFRHLPKTHISLIAF